jgi:hypothetical protein
MTERPEEKAFPRMRIHWKAFQKLSEYSASYPTGVFPGKQWRRLDGAHDPRAHLPKHHPKRVVPRWYILEYIATDETHCKVEWYKPIIYGCPLLKV